MKKLIYVLLLLPSMALQAQQLKECTKVEYVYFYSTDDFDTSMLTDLYINENRAIYQFRYSTIDHTNESDGVHLAKKEPLKNEPYQLIDKNNRQLLFFDLIGSNYFLVEDVFPDLKWEITEETKTIAEYECIKATTNFRGKIWIVWFTPEIAAPFGPWKLHGLPGLILEAKDKMGFYDITLSSIKNEKTELFSLDFASLMDTKNKKPMSIKSFLESRDEFKENSFKKLQAKYNVVRVKKDKSEKQFGLELEYEWDKEAK